MPQHVLPTSSSLLNCKTPAARPTRTWLRALQLRYFLCIYTFFQIFHSLIHYPSDCKLNSPSDWEVSFVANRSISLCRQRWRAWWIQARWELKSETSPLAVWWSTSPSPSSLVKAKMSVLHLQLYCTPSCTAPNTPWIRTIHILTVCLLVLCVLSVCYEIRSAGYKTRGNWLKVVLLKVWLPTQRLN